MKLCKILKTVRTSYTEVKIRLGPYVYSVRNNEFFDDRNKQVILTEEETQSDKWVIDKFSQIKQ